MAVLVAIGWGASIAIDILCIAEPPKLDTQPPVLSAEEHQVDGIRFVGDCWLRKKDGIIRAYLKGDPFTLGYSSGVLCQEFMKELESELLETIRLKVPSPIKLWLLKKLVFLRNRDLPDYIDRKYQLEMYGLSRGYKDPFPDFAPLYHRILNYHAAHDLSHAVMDSPLVGCTGLAAWGDCTRGGHLFIGRNFDFSAGRSFDTNKVVYRVEPDEGLGFISVSWPGMAGVITGINDARIAVFINAAQSSDKRRIGVPVSLVMREILQNAKTLEEAIKIIRDKQVFVSDLYMVADGKTSRAVIVEKTPLRCAVWKTKDQYLVCSNHFMSDKLKDDPRNIAYMKHGTSVARYDRLTHLIRNSSKKMTPEIIAGFLRDRHVPKMDQTSMGNALSINPLIATHSVIMDVTAGIIWVSASPHQLGKYIPFSLKKFDKVQNVAAIAADPLLADGSYDNYVRSQELIKTAQSLMDKGCYDEAISSLQEASKLNENYYLPYLLLGKCYLKLEKHDKAKKFLRRASAKQPAYGDERKFIKQNVGE